MTVFVVVPIEECPAESAGVLNGTESIREVWPVLHGSELRLRKWIVIGNIGPRVSLGHAEIGEQLSNGLTLHRRSPISMHGELAGPDILLGAGFGDKLLSKRA